MTATEAKPRAAAHAAGDASSTQYGKSWAEDIQKYHAAKATLPWRPEQQTPVQVVTRYDKSREEREYDLVLGKFRDAEKELQRHESDASKRKQNLEHSRARQLRNVQRFNLVNHSPMYAGARDPTDPPAEPRSFRRTSNADYNIVTNAEADGARAGADTPSSLPSPPLSPAAQNHRKTMREFNILTNKFHDHHEQREQRELRAAKERAAATFTTKNDFHPVRIAFFDADKETQFQAARAREQQTHGSDRATRLPPREQFAEGRIYDIVNQRVLNAAQIARFDGHAERAQSKAPQHAFEKRMLAFGAQLAAREEQLCLNRYAHERHAQSFVHGFDPITNEPFDGVRGKPRVATRTHAALPAWQVLEQGVPSTTKIAAVGAATAKEARDAGETQRQSLPTHGGSARRANVLVVDHAPPSQAAPPASQRVASARDTEPPPAIRTGGFS